MELIGIIWLLIWAGWILFLLRTMRQNPRKNISAPKPIFPYALIIPVRNEEQVIRATIESILKMPGGPEKIWICNDHSTDGTLQVLENIQNSRIQVVTSAGTGKKAALQTAYAIASKEYSTVLFTDADACWPENGMDEMAGALQKTGAVLACAEVNYGSKRNIISTFNRADMEGMMRIARALAFLNRAFVCSGAGLGVNSRKLGPALPNFRKVESGDDVFLLHAVSEKFGRKAIIWLSDIQIRVPAILSIRDFIRTRMRWAGKTRYYRQTEAMGISLFIWLMHVLGLILVMSGIWWIFPIKTFVDALFFGKELRFRHIHASMIYWLYIPLLPIFSWIFAVKWKE